MCKSAEANILYKETVAVAGRVLGATCKRNLNAKAMKMKRHKAPGLRTQNSQLKTQGSGRWVSGIRGVGAGVGVGVGIGDGLMVTHCVDARCPSLIANYVLKNYAAKAFERLACTGAATAGTLRLVPDRGLGPQCVGLRLSRKQLVRF